MANIAQALRHDLLQITFSKELSCFICQNTTGEISVLDLRTEDQKEFDEAYQELETWLRENK